MYDWGRVGLDDKPRELHTDQAVGCIDYGAELPGLVRPQLEPVGGDDLRACLVDADSFRVDLVEIHGTHRACGGGLAGIFVVVGGQGGLSFEGDEREWPLERGQTWLLPACLGQPILRAAGEGLEILEVHTRAISEDA